MTRSELRHRFTPEGRAAVVGNVKRALWAVADVLVHVAITVGVLIVSSGEIARDVWRDLRDHKYRCSKCGTRHAWVLCDTCRHEQQHRRAE